MKNASITEAKNNLSALIDSVKGGSPVLIVERGRPVARLESVRRIGSEDDDRVPRLVREGVVRPARGAAPRGCSRLGRHVRRKAPPVSASRRAPRRPLKFWDASAVVPLLMTEATTKTLQGVAAVDPSMLVWWATEVECASAIARLERLGELDAAAVIEAFDRLKVVAEGWHEVDPSDAVREASVRFLRVHQLRAADALQLAAAFVAAERRPASLEIVTLDERLVAAAR